MFDLKKKNIQICLIKPFSLLVFIFILKQFLDRGCAGSAGNIG